METKSDIQIYVSKIFGRDCSNPSVQKRRSELYNEFFNSLFNQTEIRESLDKQLIDTLDSLLWTTQMGYISLRNERGRQIWRGVFDYLQKHELNSSELYRYKPYRRLSKKEEAKVKKELFQDVQNNLYSSVHTTGSGRGISNYFLTEALGMITTGITCGLIAWWHVANPIESRINRRFFEKLGLLDKNPEKDIPVERILQTS